MLALVMCLLVLGVAGAVVLRDGLREGTDKRATAPPLTRRAHHRRRRSRPPMHRPVRSGVVLLLTTTGLGVATGAGLGLLGLALALALRSVGGDAP